MLLRAVTEMPERGQGGMHQRPQATVPISAQAAVPEGSEAGPKRGLQGCAEAEMRERTAARMQGSA